MATINHRKVKSYQRTVSNVKCGWQLKNLLATGKIAKNKLKSGETDNSCFYLPLQAKRNNKLIKLLQGLFKSEFDS